MKRVGKLLFVALLAVMFMPLSSKAAVRKGIQISPLTYNFEIKDSQSTTGKIVVTNLNDKPLNYVLEVENFASVDDDGAPSFAGKEPDGSTLSLADWFTFDAPKEGTIEPNKDKEINFTINIPEGAEPGGHYAAVFARELTKNAEGKTELGVASRVGTLVLVSVPGEVRRGAEVSEFTYPKFVWKGPNSFTLKAKNTGTVHFDSKGNVELKPLLGGSTNVDMGTHTIVPKSSRNYEGSWNNKYPFGRYAITASVTDGNGQLVTTTGVVWAIPVVIVVPLLIILLLIYLTVHYFKKHFKYQK